MVLEFKQPEITLTTKGKRLAHILDIAGFNKKHGRILDFHDFLSNKRPIIFSNLKYSTVQAWFSKNSPTLDKMTAIIEALNEDYPFLANGVDIEHVKIWWKEGGYYPFSDHINTVQEEAQIYRVNQQETEYDLLSTIKRVDSVYIGQVYLLIYQTASELNINLVTEIKKNTLTHLFNKIEIYCQEHTLDIDSNELKELITSFIRLAKKDLL